MEQLQNAEANNGAKNQYNYLLIVTGVGAATDKRVAIAEFLSGTVSSGRHVNTSSAASIHCGDRRSEDAHETARGVVQRSEGADRGDAPEGQRGRQRRLGGGGRSRGGGGGGNR